MSAAAGSKKPDPPPPLLPPPPPGPGSSPVKCPRCDSPNTKFCYYNNYSLSQPRHFCKTCRRYWTKGGALRNVPVGGGCRKSKKSSKSSASTTTLASSNTTTAGSTNYLQLGVGGNQFVGFNYPTVVGDTMYGTIGGGGNITMSIESLSSMNQDLHWKLQQQRLAMLFGGATATATATATAIGANSTMMSMENVHHQVADPISFHHLQVPVMEVGPNGEICGPTQRVLHHHSTSDVATTWFLESSTSSSAIAPSGGNAASSVGNEWNGMIPNWSDMQQFNALP